MPSRSTGTTGRFGAVGTLRWVGLLAALYWVVALVLVVAGVGKLVDGGRTRDAMARLGLPAPRLGSVSVGLWEVLLGGAALLAPPSGAAVVVALLVGASYLALAVVVVVAMRRGLDDCGCIGVRASAPSGVHVVVNLASAAIAAAAAILGPDDLVTGLDEVGLPWSFLLAAVVAGVAGAVVALPGGSAADE